MIKKSPKLILEIREINFSPKKKKTTKENSKQQNKKSKNR